MINERRTQSRFQNNRSSIDHTYFLTYTFSRSVGVNLTCGKNEMWISIPKYILHGLDREHLRLNDLKCGAKETKTHFILHTKLTECQTLSRSTKHFVSYTNNVLEIPVAPH